MRRRCELDEGGVRHRPGTAFRLGIPFPEDHGRVPHGRHGDACRIALEEVAHLVAGAQELDAQGPAARVDGLEAHGAEGLRGLPQVPVPQPEINGLLPIRGRRVEHDERAVQ